MHSIAALLDEITDLKVKSLWATLARDFGLTERAKRVPYPHISFQQSADYEIKQLALRLKEFTLKREPFQVTTSGLGLFTEPKPVLYVTVRRDPKLTGLHFDLWEEFEMLGYGLNDFYTPEYWTPHITLAEFDQGVSQLADAIEVLSEQGLTWKITVSRLALVYNDPIHGYSIPLKMRLGG